MVEDCSVDRDRTKSRPIDVRFHRSPPGPNSWTLIALRPAYADDGPFRRPARHLVIGEPQLAVEGGAIRTAELTAPGYRHEVFSCWHPLFVGGPAYPGLKDDLDRRGLTYRNTATPTGVAMTGGAAAVLSTDEDALTAELDQYADGDGAVWRREMDEFGAQSKLAFGATCRSTRRCANRCAGATAGSTACPWYM
ncbi:hypothetical protein [Dactylosporangium sp. NPDC049140]|uniref:hypothetical protein n=1 Tax=Dactylosporangium sp. NPDC049140 TaxID=3155647 RepID=UPI0033F0A3C2